MISIPFLSAGAGLVGMEGDDVRDTGVTRVESYWAGKLNDETWLFELEKACCR